MQFRGISRSVLLLVLSSSCSNVSAFQTTQTATANKVNTLFSSSTSQLMMAMQDNNKNGDDEQENGNKGIIESNTFSRRSVLTNTALAGSILFTNDNNANAIDFDINLNPLTPIDRRSTNNYQYTPAKRSTSYLVDSTIPPTLVPFKAQREAAILKGLGTGKGTQKTPFIEEKLTLNNMMNKGVFGTIDFVKEATGNNNIENEGGEGSTRADGASNSNKKSKGYDKSFVFLGVDYNKVSGEDTQLAIDLISDITKPRRGLDTAISLSFIPVSLQRPLNEYMSSSDANSEQIIIDILVNDGQVPAEIVMNQLPILQYAKSKQIKLIASSPDATDKNTVRTQGLQNIDPERRAVYVTDAEGFINWTQEQKSKLYTERSLLKDWKPINESETSPSGFFAEKILEHETIATRMANYVYLDGGKKNSLVINVSPIADVRFLGGPNGRIARICKAIKPDTAVDEEAVTTILINPSAEKTLSQSRFLRLEIGTGPSTLAYQTKVADYLWFSSTPKVNLLPRLMNG